MRESERWMPPWESMWLPLFMMRSFLSFPHVVQNITGSNRGDHICVVAGTEDKLMGVALMEKLSGCFREAVKEHADDRMIHIPEEVEEGVRFITIKGADHPLQNDLVWGKVLDKYYAF